MNIIQFERYVEGCLVTWNHSVFDHELINAALGVVGEFVEFHQTLLTGTKENQTDEAGDLLFYSTVLLYNIVEYEIKNLSIDNDKTVIQNTAENMNEAYLFPDLYPFSVQSFNDHSKFYATLKYVGFIVEHVKKYIYHGKPLDPELISESILQILMWLYYILNIYNIELQDVMTYNFEKLSKRYPEGFKRLAEKYNS